MKKFAFTFAEIVVAIVVMAVVVATVVPITRDKFVKADYTSYYLGYKTLRGIKIIVETEDTEDDSGCFAEVNGVCLAKAPFAPEPITKAECEELKSSLGINACLYDSDYWAGAVKACGGKDKMASKADLAKIANYAYNTSNVSETNDTYNLTWNETRFTELGISRSEHIWTTEEVLDPDCVGCDARYMVFGDTWTSFVYQPRDTNPKHAICLGDVKSNESEPVDYLSQFCENTAKDFNVAETLKTCNISTDLPQAILTKDFSFINPNLTLPNGLKIYIASDFAEIEALNDSVDENDRVGFVVYVDIDGTRSKSKLYDDVFPFYLTKSGKVIPGYDASIIAGANCEKSLAFDILYDDFSSGDRKLKRLDGTTLDNTDTYSFKNAACLSGYVKSLKYCGFDPAVGKEVNGINCNTNTQADCRIRVRKPIRIFN